MSSPEHAPFCVCGVGIRFVSYTAESRHQVIELSTRSEVIFHRDSVDLTERVGAGPPHQWKFCALNIEFQQVDRLQSEVTEDVVECYELAISHLLPFGQPFFKDRVSSKVFRMNPQWSSTALI